MVEGGPGTYNAYRDDITFEDYGSNKKPPPVISGSLKITGWTKESKNVWVSSAISRPNNGNSYRCGNNDYPEPANGHGIVQLFKNGKRLTPAREPNEGKLYKIASSSGMNNFRSSKLQGKNSNRYVNANARVRTFSWIWQVQTVSSFSSSNGQVNLGGSFEDNQGTSGSLLPDWGFYFDGKEQYLDQEGEWYYDYSTRRVKLYTKKNPSKSLIEGTWSAYADGICLFWSKGHTIRNIDFKHQAGTGIKLWLVEQVNVRNVHQSGSYGQGIELPWGARRSGAPQQVDISIRDSTFSDNLDGGFRSNAPSSDQDWGNTEVRNCKFLNNGLVPGYGISVGSWYHNNAVRFGGGATQILFTRNYVEGCGSTCIAMEGPSRVEENRIRRGCLVYNDCSNIVQNADGIEIVGNIISETYGNMEGSGRHSNGGKLPRFVWGLRSHLGNDNALVRKNTFAFNQAEAILVEGTTGHSINNNLFFLNGNPQRGRRQIALESSTGTSVQGNEFVGFEKNVYAGGFYEPVSAISFSNNQYCHPNEAIVGETNSNTFNLNQWQNNEENSATGCPNLPSGFSGKSEGALHKKVLLLCNTKAKVANIDLGNAQVRLMNGNTRTGQLGNQDPYSCTTGFLLSGKVPKPTTGKVSFKKVKVSKITSSAATVSWKIDTNYGSFATKYQVHHRFRNSGSWTKWKAANKNISPDTTKLSIKGLKSNKNYQARVTGQNDFGKVKKVVKFSTQ